MKTLTRRQFGRVSGSSLLGALVLGGCVGKGRMSRVPDIDLDELGVSHAALRDALRAYFEPSELDGPASLGDRLSFEHDEDALRQRIEDATSVIGDAPNATNAAQQWGMAVAADFQDGRVESLAGWQLSVTELTLCLLSAALRNQA